MSNPVSPSPGSQSGPNSLKVSESTDTKKNEKKLAIGKVSEKTFTTLPTPPIATKRRSATRPERHKHEKEEPVTREFVEKYNNTIASRALQEKAERLIENMKRLGGLVGNLDPKELDINSARRGLAVLSGIKNNDVLKLDALSSLYALIKADPLKEESAQGLVSVILALTEHMHVANLQSETPQAQLGLVKVYGAVARLIIYYQSQKHTNAITSELKLALTRTISNLAEINQTENVQLNFHLQYALEGIIRIKDDINYLDVILQLLFHMSMAAASYEFQTDLSHELKKCFQTLEPIIKQRAKKSGWYDYCLTLVPLSRGAISDIDFLVALQEIISRQAQKQDWRFLYNSIKLLKFIVLHGEDESIRRKALQGWKMREMDLPGLLPFINFESSKKLDFKKTKFSNTGLPQPLSATEIIQKRCIEQLIKICDNSKDPIIQSILKANSKIIRAKKLELNINNSSRKISRSLFLDETESSLALRKLKRHSDSTTIKTTKSRLSVDFETMQDLQKAAKNPKRHSETTIIEIKSKRLYDDERDKLKRSTSLPEAGTPRSLNESGENI